MDDRTDNFWSQPTDSLLKTLDAAASGLAADEAARRLGVYGPNSLKAKRNASTLGLLISQFKSPIILILLFATVLSIFLGDTTDAAVILAIVLISGLLGFWQEKGANTAVAKLLSMVQVKAQALRGGQAASVPLEQIVPGDAVLIQAGDIIPGDCLILESNTLFVDESALTGETFPVEKETCVLSADTGLSQRKNCLWMGTHAISWSATAVVVHTGRNTEFGSISEHLRLKPQETEFERGIRRFGYMLMEITLMLVFVIFGVNMLRGKPALDSFLFSLALAVGLTPQLLPAIISINLSHGAKQMAQAKVVVKRLAAIENFGSMDVLCSDKTGTLTDGTVKLQSAYGTEGAESPKALLYAYLNSSFESGFVNPIDQAIRDFRQIDISAWRKLDEEPYDFTRKRLSILAARKDADGSEKYIMITKGALAKVLDACTFAEKADGSVVSIDAERADIEARYEEYSGNGYRTLGLAYRDVSDAHIDKSHETAMTFLGFITLFDPPKPDVAVTIEKLRKLGISLKVITGDNHLIAANVMRQLGFPDAAIMTGQDLRETSDTALVQKAPTIAVFAEVEPNQKERIIIALKKAGCVVGYMGDGINDVSALHDADVSISVNTAVDVAKEAADIVLLEKDLNVLTDGVLAGRVTFANTLKYIFMATSANFGNMFSMAGASLFLPFLPLLPKQILATNLLTDFPEMAIATDSVDAEMVEKPRRWNIAFIRKFMMTFGIVSSVFDFITFGALLLLLKSNETQFQTGWFVESVVSASLIVLVIRSRKPFFKSRPGKSLFAATMAILAVTVALPYTPLAPLLGFRPLGLAALGIIAGIVALYILTAEIVKRIFYRIVKF